ncbi:MAG: MerR family transcriptional regulator [Candidatus Thermofonsia Clade 1 bacterium]|jgi:methanogenic corrinoid protein MtbC1|uniref:MerR family transcriptional regulator n=1 Tax=Candidatus Thermofonsia Clade 1 bacterium TaxID=2364210 RepID=A0A2M8PAV3_9CHLR|nr:MAG: MerR family transcriptional regulator [Candidatus Thermofonsia Clade 1 bacterium]
MRRQLEDYSDEPIYNMKAVEQQTGISAATLRAWERRYLLIEPKRTPSGYRLYSDRDIALLRWVRQQMNEGLTISRVVAMLEAARQNGEAIYVEPQDPVALARQTPQPPSDFVQPLVQALISLDTERADEVIEQTFALYTMPTVYVEVIAPALIEIGELWHRGEISISIEHFATTYLRGRLLSLLQAYLHRTDMPMIIVGCAPGERHEIGALIFAVMLRQQGFNAIYLGQDVPVDDIVQTALQERAAMVCLSANNQASALALREVQPLLERSGHPNPPLFGYGGRAFDTDPALRQQVKGHYLGSDPRDAVNLIHNLLRAQRNGK